MTGAVASQLRLNWILVSSDYQLYVKLYILLDDRKKFQF